MISHVKMAIADDDEDDDDDDDDDNVYVCGRTSSRTGRVGGWRVAARRHPRGGSRSRTRMLARPTSIPTSDSG